MGAADFNTNARIEGTKEEILAIMKVLLSYTTEKKDQYNKERNCPYLTSVYVSGDGEKGLGTRLAPAEDADYLKFIEDRGNVLYVDASGPYGRFGFLDEVDLFHEMAEAAPGAKFVGAMSGFNPGGDMVAAFELKDKLLQCKYLMPNEEAWEDEEDEEDDWDENDDECWDDEEPDWDEIVVYDPIKKKYVKQQGDN